MWKVYNDTPVWRRPRRTVYFLSRTVNGQREDLKDKAGRLRTWRTYEKAEVVRDKLKHGEVR